MKRFLALLFSPEAATRIAFISFLISSPEYFWCRMHHFECCGGHLEDVDAKLVPYLTDGIWFGGFLCAVVFAFFSRITFRYVFLFFLAVGFIVLVREPLVALPIWIATTLFSLACLFGWIE